MVVSFEPKISFSAVCNQQCLFRLMPDPKFEIFQDIVTNAKETYHIPDCAAERLTADVFCDDSEAKHYRKYQQRLYRNWYFDRKWNEAKTLYQNGLDSMKHMIGYDSKESPVESENKPVKTAEKELPPYIKKAHLEEMRRLEIINSRGDKKDQNL